VFVEALVAEPAVEALDEAVLLGLPRVDDATSLLARRPLRSRLGRARRLPPDSP